MFKLSVRLGRFFQVCVVCAIGGCAGAPAARQDTTPRSAGDAAAPAALSVLPEPLPASNERTHRGLTQARQTFAAALGEPPSDRSHDALQAWVQTHVAPWIEQRREAIDDTSYMFGLSRDASVEESVLGHAVIALLHEDTAATLAKIPQPAELDDEPEIAEVFREITHAQTVPFRSAARDAYAACVNAGQRQGEHLDAFTRFCAAREERLRPAQAKP